MVARESILANLFFGPTQLGNKAPSTVWITTPAANVDRVGAPVSHVSAARAACLFWAAFRGSALTRR
jgi:hypothetical protein